MVLCPKFALNGTCNDVNCSYEHPHTHICDTCGVDFDTQKKLQAHLQGDQHRKMVRASTRGHDGGPRKCTICNVSLSSQVHVAPHVAGARHRRTLEALQKSGNVPRSQDIIVEDSERNFECLICEIQVWQTRAEHERGARHRRKQRFLAVRSALDEAEKDKHGVSVSPGGKDAFDLGLKPSGKAQMGFSLSVAGTYLHMYLHSASITNVDRGGQSCFSVNIKAKQYLNPNKPLQGTLLFDSRGNHGRFQDRMEFIFQDVTARKKFAIVKSVMTIVGNAEDYELLKPTAPYVPQIRRKREVVQEFIAGERPPALAEIQWVNTLHLYDISKALKTILDMPEVGEKMALLKKGFVPRVFAPQTHTKWFQQLLYMEEHQSSLDLERYDQDDVLLTPPKRGGYLYSLEVPGLAEKRPSVIVGDQILVRPHGSNKLRWWQGFVHTVGQYDVGLRFDHRFSVIKGEKVDIRFCLNRLVFRRMHQALHSGGLSERLLFPTAQLVQSRKPSPGTLATLNPINRLVGENPPQRLAVTAIKNLRPGSPPFIVFGPPGTGKTITIVEAIRQVLLADPNARVLACAPSNSASDIIAERLRALGPSQLFRLVAPSRSVDQLPKSLADYTLKRDNVFCVPQRHILENYRVVVSTCMSASVPFGMDVKPGHFTHIFVDEAGQACEPEALIPIKNLAGSRTNVVLSGDPKQLGPIIRSGLALKFNFGVSLLDRLTNMPIYDEASQNGITIVKLIRNFRSHHTILKFPNERFYRGELTSEADPAITHSLLRWDQLPKKGFPIIFHAILGKDMREARSPSFFNVEEASLVKTYVQTLLGEKFLLKDEHIGIIAPYHAQCLKIRQLVHKFAKGVKVGSVEEFQGQERRVMILSTVRSSLDFVQTDIRHTLGFVANPRRFNVAITRAQALLIVVGDPNILSLDPLWRSFLNYIFNSGGWKGRPQPNWDTTGDIDGETFLRSRQAQATAEENELLQRITGTIETHNKADDLDDLGDGYEAVEKSWRETE